MEDRLRCDACPWADVRVPVLDPRGWSNAQVERALRSLERIRRETDAATALLVAALPEDRDSVTSLARTVGVSAREARRRRDIASVVSAIPEAHALLASGAVSVEHIAALRSVVSLPGVRDLAQSAPGVSPEVFAHEVRRFQLASEHGNDTAARQHSLRRLSFFDGPEGMVGLSGLLPPHEGATLKASVLALVDSRWKAEHPERARELGGNGGDSREQRAVDAFLELTGITPSASRAPSLSGEPRATRVATAKPANIVVFDLQKYEAEMLDHGPVPVTASLFEAARRSLYVLYTNSEGDILKFARARREPSVAQRLAVLVRDRHCVYADCHAPPSACSVHHFNEWLRDHGHTDVEVLGLLCDPHHRHLHVGNLKATRESGGSVTIRDRETGSVVARASPKRVAAQTRPHEFVEFGRCGSSSPAEARSAVALRDGWTLPPKGALVQLTTSKPR